MRRSFTLIFYFVLSGFVAFGQLQNDTVIQSSDTSQHYKELVVAPLKRVKTNTASYQRAAKNLALSLRKFSIASLSDNYPAMQQQLANVDHFILQLPADSTGLINLSMQRHHFTTPDFVVKTSDGQILTGSKYPGNYYTGSIDNTGKSIAAISFDGNGVKGFISNANGNKVIEALPKNKTGLHILYNDKDLLQKPDFNCATKDEMVSPISKEQPGFTQRPVGTCKTVKMYVECSYAMFLANNSSIDDVINFVFSIFNASAAIYTNDGIHIQLSEMFIWTQPEDIYKGINYISGFAFAMQNKLSTDFQAGKRINADIAHFITPDGYNGGITVGNIVSLNCGNLSGSFPSAASSSVTPFPALPAYSFTVHVFTHETGHMLGSPHTQNCSWPGGAIDNCHATEGGCPPGPAPVNGGTIMSYCNDSPYGVNFLNGFGPLPSALIRDVVDRTSCISLCADTLCRNMKLQGVTATIDNNTFKLRWTKAASKYRIGFKPNTNHQWQYYEVLDADSFVLAKTNCETLYDYSIAPFCTNLNKYGTEYISMVGDSLPLQLKLGVNGSYGLVNNVIVLCAADSVNLSASVASGHQYNWYLNGQIQPGFLSDHIRSSQVGQHTVTVDINGCRYYSDTIKIARQLQNPRITASYNDLSVSFTANSSCSKTWLWNFGDGSTSVEKIITHTYLKKGIYNISLKVWDADGNLEQVQKPLQLTDEFIDSLNAPSVYTQPNSSVAFSTAFCRQVALFSVDSFKLPLIGGAIPTSRLLYLSNSLFKSPKTGTIEFKLFPQRGLTRYTSDNNPVIFSDTGYVLNISQSVTTETNKFFLFFSKWGGIQVAVDSIVLGNIANGVAGPLLLNKWNTIGISYGNQGIQVMVNGQLYASSTHVVDSAHGALLGRFNFGSYLGRIGYSSISPLMLKGFEGALDMVRFSLAQNDFTFSAYTPWQGTDTVIISKQICNGDVYQVYTTTGTYYKTTVTNTGCDSITKINLLVNAPIVVQYNLTHPLDAAKGNILIGNITGAVKPLKYVWSNGAVTKDLLNVGAGNYSLQITDSMGCEETVTYKLYQLSSRQDQWSIYPNPVGAGRQILVKVLTATDKKYSYNIYDMAGRKCLHNSMLIKAGINEIPINLNLMKGAYIIHLQHEKERHSIPFYVK